MSTREKVNGLVNSLRQASVGAGSLCADALHHAFTVEQQRHPSGDTTVRQDEQDDAAELGLSVSADLAWEQLHGGPWRELTPEWRDGFGLSCFLSALRLVRSQGRVSVAAPQVLELVKAGVGNF